MRTTVQTTHTKEYNNKRTHCGLPVYDYNLKNDYDVWFVSNIYDYHNPHHLKIHCKTCDNYVILHQLKEASL